MPNIRITNKKIINVIYLLDESACNSQITCKIMVKF